jgi:WD40 repeat protein
MQCCTQAMLCSLTAWQALRAKDASRGMHASATVHKDWTRDQLFSLSPIDPDVAGADTLVVCLPAGEGQQLRFLTGHTAPVCAMAFSGDGSLLATGQEGKGAAIRLWDYASGQCLAVLSGEQRTGA